MRKQNEHISYCPALHPTQARQSLFRPSIERLIWLEGQGLLHPRNLRIDTHLKNLPMQRSLKKAGFTRCGTIFTRDGTPREAYWKSGAENTAR